MGYSGRSERLWPGEARLAFLPWAWMADDDKIRLTSTPQTCEDCRSEDLPWVAGWKLCVYCNELRQLRRRDHDAH